MVRISLMCDRRTRSRFGPNLTHWPAMARVTLSFLAIVILPQSLKAAQRESPNGSRTAQRASPNDSASLPRGKKLMLKDGSFQLVREYRVEGDRVRYYSLDRSQWEEIPSDLVDWDATGKAAAQEQRRESAIVERVHNQEA